MTHAVTALIGAPEHLAPLAAEHRSNRLVALSEGFSLLPLPHGVDDTMLPLTATQTEGGFVYLTAAIIDRLTEVSRGGRRFAYVETDYFGGVGGQGAAVFEDGAVIFGPHCAPIGPINEALGVLGVVVTPPAIDAFDTVGLGRFRSTDAWIGNA